VHSLLVLERGLVALPGDGVAREEVKGAEHDHRTEDGAGRDQQDAAGESEEAVHGSS
jgi:hypothetical protein